MKALVLGGGKCNVALFSVTKEKYKSKIRLKNKPMIEYVINALLNSKSIDSIDVYIEKENSIDFPNNEKIKVHFSNKNPMENILDFIYKNSEALKDSPFLLCTSDLPLLKSEIIDEFIKKGVGAKKEFVIPIVSKKEITKKFPSMKRTYIHINKQEWCGGNIFLMEKDFFIRNVEVGKFLFSNRKSVLKSGRLFGWRALFRLFIKKLSFGFIEKETKKRLGGVILPLIFNHTEVAVDVDKVSDYTVLNKYLEKALS